MYHNKKRYTELKEYQEKSSRKVYFCTTYYSANKTGSTVKRRPINQDYVSVSLLIMRQKGYMQC